MKIIVLEGSPNKNGSSNLLAAEFIHGAEEAGHSVQVIDSAHGNIHPCTGCIHCGYEGKAMTFPERQWCRLPPPAAAVWEERLMN